MLTPVEQAIAGGASAPEAWSRTLDELAGAFSTLDDAYQRERAQMSAVSVTACSPC